MESLDIESSLQKRIPSAKAHISDAAGLCLLAKAQLRLFFHNSFIKNLRNYRLFFFFNVWETDKQNHFIHGINVPLTYKLNLKKMSLFLRNAYKGKKLFFMTEKSFTVDQLIKHFGPKVQFNLKKNCHTGTVWENISISRISMGKNKLSLFQKKSFL